MIFSAVFWYVFLIYLSPYYNNVIAVIKIKEIVCMCVSTFYLSHNSCNVIAIIRLKTVSVCV